MANFYFTYGTWEGFPYCKGYSVVVADDMRQAIRVFRAVHPDVTKGIVNCAFYYTEEQFGDYRERWNEPVREIIKLTRTEFADGTYRANN